MTDLIDLGRNFFINSNEKKACPITVMPKRPVFA